MNTATTPKSNEPSLIKRTAAKNPKQVYIPAAILYNEALEAVAGICDPSVAKQFGQCFNGVYSS